MDSDDVWLRQALGALLTRLESAPQAIGSHGLAEMIDEIAERIRTIGHFAEGRLKEIIKLAQLEEPDPPSDQPAQLANLIGDHETIINRLRKLIKDFDEKHKDIGSSDFVTGLLKQHEKMAWMLRSYLR